jgi:hypothetical protein
VISETNAAALLTDAYMGGDMGSFPVPLGAVRGGEGLGSKGSTVFNAAMIMKEAVSRIDRDSLVNNPAVGKRLLQHILRRKYGRIQRELHVQRIQ